MEKITRDCVGERVDKRGTTEHVGFIESIMPADSPLPTDPRELTHLGSVAVQLMFAGFNSMSDWFYSTIFFLLEELESYGLLIKEIRDAFKNYEDITPGALNSLQYLHACLEESLRLFNSNSTGLPRISPGAVVDGHYIPKGAHVETNIFALARSPRYIHDPLPFRPQHWLPSEHPLYNLKLPFLPFRVGPRHCMGKETAWMQGKLFIAKVLWLFDVIKVPGQNVGLEGTLLHYGFFVKPEVRVRSCKRQLR
ncbi:cytochrome P450 [Leptodontidium sp. MPI-SDFR-AT-0119]|nr:cytochrome P450 [Leptodontidium sp. MPI-SDFR-AT-0119]